MKIYITGASGFIGRHLVKYLEQYNMAVYKAEVDITNNFEVKNEIEKISPDKVIHLAAIVSTPWADEADWYSIDVNVRGTYNIAKYSRKVEADFIYVSSTSIYKPTNEVITEESPIKPTTIYNLTKYMGEEIVNNVYGEDFLILRLCHIYGPNGDHCSIPMKIVRNTIEGYPTVILASPESVRSYLFIDDLLELFLKALLTDLKGVYNVSSEEYMTLKKIVEITISELTKKDFKPSIIVWRPETDYMGSHKVSCGKIANRLGWNPKVKFSEGIAKCIESFHP